MVKGEDTKFVRRLLCMKFRKNRELIAHQPYENRSCMCTFSYYFLFSLVGFWGLNLTFIYSHQEVNDENCTHRL